MIEELFEHYRRLTGGDVGAAATLVLAHVQVGRPAVADAEMLTPKQAADILGVSARTVHKLCREGLLRSVGVGRLIRIRRDSLDEYTRQGLKLKPREHDPMERHRRRLRS